MKKKYVKYFVLVGGISSPAWAQTTIDGSNLALQSSGAASGSGWTLSSNGYVGTYIDLSQAGAVTFTVDASGTTSGGLNPDMTISIANSTESFDVNSSNLSDYTYTTPTLAAGTYFVRTQLDNQNATQTPDLTVGSLTVSGTGVSVSNSNTSANALTAATDYAQNYREGPATIALTNGNGNALGAGTQVQVKLIDNAFNFAGAVYGESPYSDPSAWLNGGVSSPVSAAPNTTEEINYQNAILQNFNMIVPSNAGKWVNNEYTHGSVNMNLVDAMTDFASQNGLGVRMHNMFWDNEQPPYITSLFNANGTISASNLTTLESDMTSRVAYYLGGDNGALGTPRTDSYQEVDVFNELWHGQADQINYLGALGYQGVANYYAAAAAAVSNAGSNTRLMTNEYNVLQFSPASISSTGVASGSDNYANWYLHGVQQIQNDGGPVSGIGMELYINPDTAQDPTEDQISPAEMEQAMQNLSVDKTANGTPVSLSLTEFGVASGAPSVSDYTTDLTEALTMIYGTPQATTFGYWGGIGGPNDSSAYSLYNSSYQLTSVGEAYEAWMAQYDTNETLTTNADGQVSFNGTYGIYDVTVDGTVYELDLEPGTTNYGLMTPISTATWDGGGSNSNWSTSGNWSGTLVTNAPLIFAGTAGLTPNNDSTAGTDYSGITFDSGAGAFVIGGNAIDLGGDIVNNSSNTQTINLALALQQNTNINAATGNITIGGAISGAFSLTAPGSHVVTLTGSNSYSGGTTVSAGKLVIGAAGALPANGSVSITGGTLQLALNTGGETLSSLSISSGGALDLGNNHMIISDAGGSIDSTIRAYLSAGYNGGNWNGASGGSVMTSAPITIGASTYSIGYADGADSVVAGLLSGELEVAYTLAGDANLDGKVDSADFGILADNYGASGAVWDEGDFNYDGKVDSADFGILAVNYGQSAGSNADVVTAADWSALNAFASANSITLAQVPEPATTGLMLLSAISLPLRRRRRRSMS